MFNSDVVVVDDAIFYRLNTKKQAIEIFKHSMVIHRNFNQYDEYICFHKGNSVGTVVSREEGTVANKNGLYFYIWSKEAIPNDILVNSFREASNNHCDSKIESLNKKIDHFFNMKLNTCKALNNIEFVSLC